MRIIICAKEYLQSEEKLNELIKDVEILRVEKYKNSCYFETVDNDLYCAITDNDKFKAGRCDKIYIKNGVNQDFINAILYPLLSQRSLEDENRVVYF